MVTTDSRPSDATPGPSRRADDDRPGSEGVLARMLREALRTPAYREILRLHAREIRRGQGADLVRVALQQDREIWLGLTSTTPPMVDDLVQSLSVLGQQLAAMPEPLVDGYLAQLVAELDREALTALPAIWAPLLARALPGALNLAFDATAGVAETMIGMPPAERTAALRRALQSVDSCRAARAINHLTALVLAVQRDAPDLLVVAAGPERAALLQEVDAGRLRQAVVAMSAGGRAGAESLVSDLLDDPVAVANLVGLLPPLVNDGLGLLRHVVDALELPDEVLASAIFNVLRALDMGEVGRLVSGAASTVDTLHRGSAILGFEEPAFEAVAVDLLDGLLDTLDLDAVARAAVALGEDGEVVARVLARRIATDPGLLDAVVDTLTRLSNLGLGTALQVARELEQLPPGTGQVVAKRLGELDGRNLAELCNHALALAEAVSDEAAGTPVWTGLWDGVDRARARRLLWRFGVPVIHAAVTELWQRIGREPEQLAGQINDALRRFNRFVDDDSGDRDRYLSRLVGTLDGTELGRAWRGGARLLGRRVLAADPPDRRLGAWLHRGAQLVSRRWMRSDEGSP